MMNWTKQVEEMAKTWTETQKMMWNNWLGSIQGLGQSQSTEVWTKTIETWERSVNSTLEAQNEWNRMWTESFTNLNGLPKESLEWANQTQEMTKRWSDVQKQLWGSWFDIVKKIDPTKMAGNWNNKESQNVLQIWQESAQKIMQTQAEWARLWTSSAGIKTDETS